MYCPAILSTNFFSQTERLENEDRQQGQNSPSSRHDRQEHSQIKLLPPAPKLGVTNLRLVHRHAERDLNSSTTSDVVWAFHRFSHETTGSSNSTRHWATENKLSANVSKASLLKRRLVKLQELQAVSTNTMSEQWRFLVETRKLHCTTP